MNNNNPWQQPPSNRGQPPDLNEIFNKLPFTPSFFVIPVVLLVIWGIFTSFYTVQPEEQAVVKRLGAVIDITDPGLHFKLPFGIDRVQHVASARVLKQEFGFRTVAQQGGRSQYVGRGYEDESLMLTGDLNIILVEWVVQYRIQDPIRYLYQQREPDRTLRDISESVMRRVVGNRIGSDVLTVARVEISQQARDEIQEIMDSYNSGLNIITVELQDVVPPANVQPAFNEVNEARQERERMINEANKQANQQIPRAEGEAQRVVADAQGYATERVNHALGETARFQAIYQEYQSVPDVTRSRLYLETLTEVLPNIGSILMVQEANVGPLPLLNIDERRGQRAQPQQQQPQRVQQQQQEQQARQQQQLRDRQGNPLGRGANQ